MTQSVYVLVRSNFCAAREGSVDIRRIYIFYNLKEAVFIMDIGYVLGTIIGIALLGLIPGFIAKSRGRSFWGFWLLGVFFLLPSIIVALAVENKKEARMRNEKEYAGYEKLYKEGKITKNALSEKKKEIFGEAFGETFDW